MKDDDLWCLGYGGLYCCILVASTPAAVDLVVLSQCVWLKKAFQAVLSKEKNQTSLDWTHLPPPMKVLRDEFAPPNWSVMQQGWHYKFARQSSQYWFPFSPPRQKYLDDWEKPSWLLLNDLNSLHSLAPREHCSCNLTSFHGSETSKDTPHLGTDPRHSISAQETKVTKALHFFNKTY